MLTRSQIERIQRDRRHRRPRRPERYGDPAPARGHRRVCRARARPDHAQRRSTTWRTATRRTTPACAASRRRISQHPEYARLMRHPKIIGVLRDLWGPDIRFDTAKLNMKCAGFGAPVEWHQDWAFYPHTNDNLAAVGVMFDDMAMANGPLMIVPGSHRGPIFDHHADGIFCGAMDPANHDVDYAGAIPLTGRAGSITVHHVRAVHGSAPNVSDRDRRLLLFQYPRRRCLAVARLSRRHRGIQGTDGGGRASRASAGTGAGAAAAAAGDASKARSTKTRRACGTATSRPLPPRSCAGAGEMSDRAEPQAVPIEPIFDRTPQPFGDGLPDPIVYDGSARAVRQRTVNFAAKRFADMLYVSGLDRETADAAFPLARGHAARRVDPAGRPPATKPRWSRRTGRVTSASRRTTPTGASPSPGTIRRSSRPIVGAAIARPNYGGILLGPHAAPAFDPTPIERQLPGAGHAWPFGRGGRTAAAAAGQAGRRAARRSSPTPTGAYGILIASPEQHPGRALQRFRRHRIARRRAGR